MKRMMMMTTTMMVIISDDVKHYSFSILERFQSICVFLYQQKVTCRDAVIMVDY